jgi:hypothetical protein
MLLRKQSADKIAAQYLDRDQKCIIHAREYHRASQDSTTKPGRRPGIEAPSRDRSKRLSQHDQNLLHDHDIPAREFHRSKPLTMPRWFYIKLTVANTDLFRYAFS